MLYPRILVNNLEVIAHGVVSSFGRQPIDIIPFPPPVDKYVIRLAFSESDGGASEYVSVTENPALQVVTFKNFERPGGVATSVPAYVANYQGRKVMLSAIITFFGEPERGLRSVQFTLHDGGPANG